MSEDAQKPQEITRKGQPMSDEDLLALIRAYELAALGSSVSAGMTVSTTVYPSNQAMTTLEIDRYNALNAYFGRPLGNEVENRSQIVLPEVRDTIEWIMPQLMRMFMASKSVCRFDAENENDEQQAELETEVVNQIFLRQNNGFFVMHDYFKDALLMRNGYSKVYWQEETHADVERYTGLTEIELASVMAEEEGVEIEVISQREYPQVVRLPLPPVGPQGLPPGAPPPQLEMTVQCFDVSIRRKQKKGRVCVKCIPPEEMRVTSRAREGMEDLAYACHLTTTTRSDLIADGYDREWVESLTPGRPNWMDMDSLARNQVTDQLAIESPSDRSMQEIELREVIMRVDYDGDGVAELRRILVGGDKIGSNEETEETEFTSCVSKRMPHRHTGMSLYDEVMDLQILKTTLFRAGLDNLMIANNARVAVDYQSANFDDLLTSRPGGVVRGKGPPSSWIAPLEQNTNLTSQVIPALEYIDKLRTVRTGVGEQTMGVDADDLQNVTKGAQMSAMSAASMKMEMIARMLAEGVKDIFCKIHSTLIRHQDKPLEFEIAGKWVQVDPSSWRRRTKVSPNVGLGSGNREEMRTNVQMLTVMQQQLAQLGLVGPKQAYQTFKMGCEALGFHNPEQYAMDPAGPEYAAHMQQVQQQMQNQPPDPAVQVAKIRQQTEVEKAQASGQTEVVKLQGKLSEAQAQIVAEREKAQAELAHAALENHRDREIDLDANHAQVVQTVMKVLGPIIASQLKGDPNANAGQVLADDTRTADAGIEQDRFQPILDSLHQAIGNLSKPKTATLPDGRQVTIQ